MTGKLLDKLLQRKKALTLQHRLEQDGHTLERLTLYVLTHHDHHFLCKWGIEQLGMSLAFDKIRAAIEEDFNDLYVWIHQDFVLNTDLKVEILRLSYFLTRGGAHDWSMLLAFSWLNLDRKGRRLP